MPGVLPLLQGAVLTLTFNTQFGCGGSPPPPPVPFGQPSNGAAARARLRGRSKHPKVQGRPGPTAASRRRSRPATGRGRVRRWSCSGACPAWRAGPRRASGRLGAAPIPACPAGLSVPGSGRGFYHKRSPLSQGGTYGGWITSCGVCQSTIDTSNRSMRSGRSVPGTTPESQSTASRRKR